MSIFNKLAPHLLKPLSDEQYTRVDFLWHQYSLPHLRDPETLSEKILWLKLHYRSPLLVQCADKLLVRDYVRSLELRDILVPLLGVYERAEDIPYNTLPDQFILKATHGSGWNMICRSRSSFDSEAATARLSKYLRTNYYDFGREWVYKEIRPRIICEKLLLDSAGGIPVDYRVFCFLGEPRLIQVEYARFGAHTRNIYDADWHRIPCRHHKYPNNEEADDSPPEALGELLAVARRLSSAFPFVRVDLYALGRKVYFGELTFFPGRGVFSYVPSVYNRIFGSYLDMRAVEGYEKTMAESKQ